MSKLNLIDGSISGGVPKLGGSCDVSLIDRLLVPLLPVGVPDPLPPPCDRPLTTALSSCRTYSDEFRLFAPAREGWPFYNLKNFALQQLQLMMIDTYNKLNVEC
jgi:hypothetical protein